MGSQINAIPDFSSDSQGNSGTHEEVKPEATQEEVAPSSGTDTPPVPPTENKPGLPEQVEDTGATSTGELEKAVQGLQTQRAELLKEISELRGQRRELKQQELAKVDQQIEDIKDVNPEDAALIERVLRSKGYVSKEDVSKMFYEAVKQEELGKFLERYPEYKPENDSTDLHWNALQREFGLYRAPDNPRLIGQLLERAHRNIAKAPSERDTAIKKRQIEVASVGGGGVQRSSSQRKSFDADKRYILAQGGWTEEEIRKMEESL